MEKLLTIAITIALITIIAQGIVLVIALVALTKHIDAELGKWEES